MHPAREPSSVAKRGPTCGTCRVPSHSRLARARLGAAAPAQLQNAPNPSCETPARPILSPELVDISRWSLAAPGDAPPYFLRSQPPGSEPISRPAVRHRPSAQALPARAVPACPPTSTDRAQMNETPSRLSRTVHFLPTFLQLAALRSACLTRRVSAALILGPQRRPGTALWAPFVRNGASSWSPHARVALGA